MDKEFYIWFAVIGWAFAIMNYVLLGIAMRGWRSTLAAWRKKSKETEAVRKSD